MSSLLEHRAHAIGANFDPTRALFDLSIENRAVFDALSLGNEPFQDAFDCCRKRIPLPRAATVSMDGHFYRLPGHNRSFCYSLTQADAFLSSPVLVFKGTEPLLQDFQTLIAWMSQAPLRRSTRVMTDHFPLAEGKIPGALSIKEALREAKIALDVQQKHLKHYGSLASIPTPLLVHALSDSQRDACATLLRGTISHEAFERIEPHIQHGLAVYIYYYPAPPIRSNYWGGMVSPQIAQYIQSKVSEEAAIQGWVTLITRLLYLEYLPYSVRNDGLGACMDFGNATLDGGFCDPDSIIPLGTDLDDEFLRESVVQCLAILQNTVQLMLGLSSRPDLSPNIDDFVCAQYIRHLLLTSFVSEARPGVRLDDRLVKLLSPKTLAEVRLCTTRRNRVGSYVHFAARSRASHPGSAIRATR